MANWLSTRSLGSRPKVKGNMLKPFQKKWAAEEKESKKTLAWDYPKLVPTDKPKGIGNWLQGLMGTKPSKSKKMVW